MGKHELSVKGKRGFAEKKAVENVKEEADFQKL